MKKTTIMDVALLFIVTMMIASNAFAQNWQILTETEPVLNYLNEKEGTITYHYYYDENENKVMHGNWTKKVNQMDQKGEGFMETKTMNYVDGVLQGDYSRNYKVKQPIASRYIEEHAKGKLQDGLPVGIWDLKKYINWGNSKENSDYLINIANNRIVSLSSKSDGTDFKRDNDGKVSGYLTFNNEKHIIQNGIVSNKILDKRRNYIQPTPKAKALIDKLLKGDVSQPELIENGYCFYKYVMHFYDRVEPLLPGEIDRKRFDKDFIDQESTYSYLRQIPDGQLYSFEECKKKLNCQKHNFYEFTELYSDMLDGDQVFSNDCYIKKATADSVAEYVAEIFEPILNDVISSFKNAKDLDEVHNLYNENIKIINQKNTNRGEYKLIQDAFQKRWNELWGILDNKMRAQTDRKSLDLYYNTSVRHCLKYLTEEAAAFHEKIYEDKRKELSETRP